MPPERVLVTGATGLMGSRLCEVLWLTGAMQPRALVHNTGSAARISRYPIDVAVGDLCDENYVKQAMQGCDAVVHLARGTEAVMTKGLDNVLQAAAANRVSRFVHMSSVAVYGNQPPAESVSEEAPARRTTLQYGNQKLEQERRVLEYRRRYDLPTVILRAPNVYGPYSAFTTGMLKRLRAGNIAILGEGKNPCNLVYIDNVIEAVLLCLWKPEAVGQTFFVVDNEPVTWAQCIEDYAKIVGVGVRRVQEHEIDRDHRKSGIGDSFRTIQKIVISKEFRQILRQVQLIESFETSMYNRYQSLSPRTREWIRRRVRDLRTRPQRSESYDHLVAMQARTVAHSNRKARSLLGYTAGVSYDEGMALTEDWLRYNRLA
ncbi:MAG: NAD-dependent epimerase/dehydratase family protein [Acidobacteria bacterium]|nr:NAD-dependent epimerase/dehydratase family protein [Acidobacteriota bacterium]